MSPRVDGNSRPGTSALGTTTRTREVLTHTSVQSKQRTAIEKIRRDNEELKEELLLENKLSVRPTKQTAAMRIAQLQSEADAFSRKIELEKRRIGFVELKAEDVRDKIKKLRQNMGGINASRDCDRALEKQVKILENRLEKCYRSYSEGATKNRELREMIDSYRRERLMLENINAGLEKENDKLQREMTHIIKDTKAMHESRETTLCEIEGIKARTEKMQGSYEKEWAALTAVIEEDKQAQETKRQREMEERERRTQELLHCSTNADGKTRLGRTNSKPLDKQLQAHNEAMDKVHKYSQAFERIQQATGIEDMDAVVDQIADFEDTNYTLFNFVNELGESIEALEAKIKEAERDLNAQTSGISPAVVKLQTAPVAQDQNAAAFSPEKAHHDIKGTRDKEATETVIAGTKQLAEMLPEGYIEEQLFDSTTSEEIAPENVIYYLGLVESFVEDLLKVQCKEQEGANEHLTQAFGVSTFLNQLSIAPPSTQLEEFIDDESFDDEKPALGTTLRSLVSKTMERKSRPPTVDLKKTTVKSIKRR